MKKLITVIIIGFIIIGGMMYLNKNDNKSNVVDNIYINSISYDQSTKELVFDVRKEIEQEIILEYSYVYWIEGKENDQWNDLKLDIAFVLPLFQCELDCHLGRTNLKIIEDSTKLDEGKEYRVAKNVGNYIFYSEFKVEENQLVFANVNSIEKVR